MASRKGRRPGASLARLVASAAVEAESAGGAVDGAEADRRRWAEAFSVPLSRIRVREGHNPRTRFDEESIREMAETIAAGGILQPLVVERVAGNGAAGEFWLLHGERRLRSLRWLVASGRRSEEEPVPVFVRGGLDEEERLTSALVENLQREELDPLDEAEGFAQLRDRYGRSTAEIAKAVGRSRRHVQFRLQLLTLEEGVRGWLREGGLSAVAARVLAGTPPGVQRAAVAHFREPGRRPTEEAVREWLRGRMVPLERALFEVAAYEEAGGEVWATDTGERDPGDRGRYFTDLGLFERLQGEAIEGLKEELRGRFDWVREVAGVELPAGLESEVDGPGAVVLLRNGVFEVEVVEGVREVAGGDADLLKGLERVEGRERVRAGAPQLSVPPSEERLRRAERLRAQALQAAVVRDRDAVLRLAIVGLLAAGSWCFDVEDREVVLAPAVTEALTSLAHAAGAVSLEELLASEEPGERRRARREELYLRLVPVPGKVLDVAFRALVAASVGGWPGKGEPRLESPGLACRLAEDLRVEVDEWGPPEGYFEGWSRPELEEVAREVGVEVSEGVSREELVERVAGVLVDEGGIDGYVPPELVFWDGRRGSGEGVSS